MLLLDMFRGNEQTKGCFRVAGGCLGDMGWWDRCSNVVLQKTFGNFDYSWKVTVNLAVYMTHSSI